MTTTVSTDITVDLVTTTGGFRALEADWRRLYEASPTATPFQTWDWLFTWWEVYGERGALRLFTAWSQDRLVGVLPLMADRRRRWCFVGAGLSDHLDALVLPEAADEVVAAWIDRLARSPVDLLALDDVRPSAAVWRLYGRWPGRASDHHRIFCAELDAGPWDEVIAGWSRNARKAAKQTANRVGRHGYEQVPVPPDQAGDAAEELVALHRGAWADRPITPAHADPRFTTFVRSVCERMVPHGTVALLRLEPPDGEADPMRYVNMLMVGRDYVGGWLGGENDRARDRLTIAFLDMRDALAIAHDRGIPVVSMLRGLEPAKVRMQQRALSNRRLLLAADRPLGTLAWARHSAPDAVRAWLKRWERDSDAGRRVAAALRWLRDRSR